LKSRHFKQQGPRFSVASFGKPKDAGKEAHGDGVAVPRLVLCVHVQCQVWVDAYLRVVVVGEDNDAKANKMKKTNLSPKCNLARATAPRGVAQIVMKLAPSGFPQKSNRCATATTEKSNTTVMTNDNDNGTALVS